MKRKLLTMLVAVTLIATVFTGCASEETEDVANMIESLEARHESGPGVYVPEEDGTSSEDIKSKLGIGANKGQTGEDNTGTAGQENEADTQGVDSSQSGEGAVNGETSGESITTGDVSGEGASTGEDSASGVNEDGKDWSQAYDGYFTRGNTLPEMPKVTMTASGQGVTMNITTAVAEEVVWMGLECNAAKMDIYMDNEKMYVYTMLDGKSKWTYTRIASEEEAESMLSIGEMARISDEWNGIKRYNYRSEVVINGITYDTLNVVLEDENGSYPCVFYVNRETQMVERYTCVQDGMNMDCRVTAAEPFELPEEAKKAKETDMEDIAMDMVDVILAGAQG